MTTIELTKTQEQFLADLNNAKCIVAPMVELQEKYSENSSKAAVKRNIDELVQIGLVTREHHKIFHNGRITSATIYKAK